MAGKVLTTPGDPRRNREAIAAVLARSSVDIVHLHGIDFHAYIPQTAPVLATLHLPPSWYPEEVFRLDQRNLWLNCVSEAQHEACPPSPPWVHG